jgi:hypothetical protein
LEKLGVSKWIRTNCRQRREEVITDEVAHENEIINHALNVVTHTIKVRRQLVLCAKRHPCF